MSALHPGFFNIITGRILLELSSCSRLRLRQLRQVTKMASSMVAVYGMNAELGLVSYGQNNASEQFYKPYSDLASVKAAKPIILVLGLKTQRDYNLKAMS